MSRNKIQLIETNKLRRNGKPKIDRVLVHPEWEIQPAESPECFELFRIYKSLGRSRSQRGVAFAIGTPKELMKKEQARIGNVSARWRWVERIQLWEKFIDEKMIEEEIAIRKEMNRRLAEHAKSAEMAIMTVIKEYIDKYNNQCINFEDMEDEILFKLVIMAVEKLPKLGDFERLVRGEPSEYIKQETITKNIDLTGSYDDMSHEELMELAKQLGFSKRGRS